MADEEVLLNDDETQEEYGRSDDAYDYNEGGRDDLGNSAGDTDKSEDRSADKSNPGVETGDANNLEERKLFVGGLSWETTEERFKEHFGKFGEVVNCIILRDPVTKRSRGFGFIIYRNVSDIDKALSHATHVIDGKEVEPKRSVPREQTRTKKIFIGGLPPNTSEDDLKIYFGQYGAVSEVELLRDKETGRLRGFGFVSFDSPEGAQKALITKMHEINGKMAQVKRAEPKVDYRALRGGRGSSQSRGGGGGNRYPSGRGGGSGGGGGGGSGGMAPQFSTPRYGQHPPSYPPYNPYSYGNYEDYSASNSSYMGMTNTYGPTRGFNRDRRYHPYH